MKKGLAVIIAVALSTCSVRYVKANEIPASDVWEDMEGILHVTYTEIETEWALWYDYSGEERSGTVKNERIHSYSLGMKEDELEEVSKVWKKQYLVKGTVKEGDWYLTPFDAEWSFQNNDYELLTWSVPVDTEAIKITIKKGYQEKTFETEIPRSEWEDVKKIIFN